MDRFVIIVAGGSGLRMGTEIPKQFLPIAGKPILLRTIDAFRNAVDGIKIIVCLPATHFDYWNKCCKEYGFNADGITIVEGGKTRFHSVLNGLNTIQADGDALVGVHDGVRPFVSAEITKRNNILPALRNRTLRGKLSYARRIRRRLAKPHRNLPLRSFS